MLMSFFFPLQRSRQPRRPRRPRQPRAPPRELPLGFCDSYFFCQPLNLGGMNLECSECKAMYWLNERQHSSSKSNPKFHTCCQGGAVKLEPIRDPPAELQELYTFTDSQAEQFRTNIRHYNGAFAFTSANYNADTIYIYIYIYRAWNYTAD